MYDAVTKTNPYLHYQGDFQSEILHHQCMLPLELLSDSGTMHQVGKAIQQPKTAPQGGAVIERLRQNGRQTPL